LTSLEEELRRSFEGEASKDPSLDLIDLDHCYDFQRKVLLRLRDIPRGMTVSYGTLARSIGAPGAARAVGTALARNPFPLVFPCHRVIRVSGEIGQFGGGTSMKESLLRREGVIFSGKGVVSPRCLVAGFRGERLQD
jgi:methylated-DNA-[protein]-cysteine S-methyltransferase